MTAGFLASVWNTKIISFLAAKKALMAAARA